MLNVVKSREGEERVWMKIGIVSGICTCLVETGDVSCSFREKKRRSLYHDGNGKKIKRFEQIAGLLN